jgi:hypothetical protein
MKDRPEFTPEWWKKFLLELGYSFWDENTHGSKWSVYRYGDYTFHVYEMFGALNELCFEVKDIKDDMIHYWSVTHLVNFDLISEMVDLARAIVDPSLAPLLVNNPAKRIVANLLGQR